jgi:hypothetical protein
VEILLQAIVPVVIIAVPRYRNSVPCLLLATSSAFLGLVLHRINTGIVGYFRFAGSVYNPNVSEFILSFGVLSAAGLLFFFLVERFYIFDEPAASRASGTESKNGGRPRLWTRREAMAIVKSPDTLKISFLSVLIIPLAILGLRDQATGPFKPIPQPVTAPIGLDDLRTRLRIDGNRNGDFVDFPHNEHKDRMGGDDSCVKCHHLAWPEDHNTACWMCHSDMEVPADFFDHEGHQRRFSAEKSCEECHDTDRPHGGENAKPCIECHRENMPGLAAYERKGFNHIALGYKHAMHGLCLTYRRFLRGAS